MRALPVHLLDRLVNTPLLLTPAKAAVLHQVLTSPDHVAALAGVQMQSSNAPATVPVAGGVAVIDVSGTLVSRSASMMASWSGLRSYESIRADLDAAMADRSVSKIVLRLDSPGGEVSGAFDLADAIRAAAARKPIEAIAADMACSAAYLLGAAASRLWITQTGQAGSVGVILLHVNRQAAELAAGVQYTEIASGGRKADGTPHRALDGQAFTALQADVNALAELFFTRVAAFRPALGVETLKSLDAGIRFGQQAVAVGLADGITTLEALAGPGTIGGAPMENVGITLAKVDSVTAGDAADQSAVESPPPAPEDSEDEQQDEADEGEDETTEDDQANSQATEATRQRGVLAERARILKLEALALPGHEASLAEAKASGWSVGRFLEVQASAERSSRQTALSHLSASAAAVAAAAPYSGVTTVASGERPIDERAKAEWDKSPRLRSEFTSFEAYRALRRHEDQKARR
jgi:signal peptide peptidase SppA